MRNCPVCDLALEEITLHEQQVDRCNHCAGIFLDKGELGAIVEMAEIFEEVKLDEREIETVPEGEVKREMVCPLDGQPMEPRDMSGIVIDVCPTCSGTWLDGGELAAIKLAESSIKTNINLYIRLGQ